MFGLRGVTSSHERSPGAGLGTLVRPCSRWTVCAVPSHCLVFATLWTVAHQAPLSMGFSRQEYWSGLPCSPPGDLSDPGIKPASLASLTFSILAGGFFPLAWTVKPRWTVSGAISDPRRVPWWGLTLSIANATGTPAPQFPSLLTSKTLWFSLFLFRRKRSLSSAFWNVDQRTNRQY